MADNSQRGFFRNNVISFIILIVSVLILEIFVNVTFIPATKYKIFKLQVYILGNGVLYFVTRYIWRRLSDTTTPQIFPNWCKMTWKVALVLFLVLSHLATATTFFLGKDPSLFAIMTWVCFYAYIIQGLMLLTFKFVSYAAKAILNFVLKDELVARITVIASILFIVHAYLVASSPPVVERVSIPISKLPPSMNGTRIALLSDIHLGPTVGYSILKTAVDITNSMNPDIIVIAGDLTDGTIKDLGEAASPLKQLSAPKGKFFVTGNHEYFSADVDNWFDYLRSIGFNILHNSNVKIHSKSDNGWFCLLGTDDLQANRLSYGDHGMDLPKAFSGCDDRHAAILVAHQPNAAKMALNSKYPIQLVLSGHTHGGQFFPVSIAIYLANPFFAGLYKYDETSYVYVTQGTVYYGAPIRTGTKCEITEVTLLSV